MNALTKKAQYMQGVRDEFLRNGFSEADARCLARLTLYKQAREDDPESFDEGFYETIGRKVARVRNKKGFLDRVMSALPWILGIGATGAIFGTPWGHRRLRDLFGSQERLLELNEKRVKPFQTDYGKSEDTTSSR